MLKPKIIRWMTYEDLEQIQNEIQIGDAMYGYTPEVHEAPFDEFHQDVLIQEIVKNNYIICGDTHQNFARRASRDRFRSATATTYVARHDPCRCGLRERERPWPSGYHLPLCVRRRRSCRRGSGYRVPP